MISGFQEWASSERLIQSSPVEQFKDRCIAIDAEDYLQKIVSTDKDDDREPLVPALAGVPFKFESILESRIQSFKDANIKPLFVFHGLITSGEQRKVEAARELVKKLDRAWDLYSDFKTESAVEEFATASSLDIDHIYRHAQSVFHRLRVPFLVAPYSAHAQMATLEGEYVDALYGPSELLTYECQRVILDIDVKASDVKWITRQSCIDSLTAGNAHMWLDSCLLAGSSLLPTLPQLDNEATTTARSSKLKAAADLLRRSGLTANQLCMQYNEDAVMQGLSYLDNFRKAYMSIQHHIVTSANGEMITLNKASAPNDVHTFIGQRLPDEVYYYVSRGIIGTRVLTWRTSGTVVEKPPVDGGSSVTYQNLVRSQIVPQRVKALNLLSQSLHRFYQHQDVELRLFFGAPGSRKLGVNEPGDLRKTITDWHVRQPAVADRMKALKVEDTSLYFAVEALTSSDFTKATVPTKGNKADQEKPLKDAHEIQSNALWKFLRMQDYITPSHELSPQGKILREAFQRAIGKGLAPEEVGESLLLGMELLRYKLLTSENLFQAPPYYGAPSRGTEVDQRNVLLISRVACLGRLKHEAIGYTGPLSRHLLAYRSIVSALRQSQRDLIDMCLCTMLLGGEVDRQVPEYELQKAGFGLGFLRDNDCSLGVAVKQYLDELSTTSDPTSKDCQKANKARAKEWFPHVVDFEGNLNHAFALFDVMAATVQALPVDVVSDSAKKEWAEAEKWLAKRR